MNMVGQTIDARSSISKTAVFLLLVVLCLVAWGVIDANPHPLVASLLPLSIACAIWFGQPAHAVVMIESDGLVPLGSPNKLYFSDIQAIVVGGARHRDDVAKLPALPIEIYHDAGCLILPAVMNVPPPDLYRYLVARVPPRPPKPVHSLLAKYHAEQQQKFGPDRIRVIQTRELFAQSWTWRRNRWVAAAILLTGLLWLAIGTAAGSLNDDDAYVGWIVFGSLSIVGSFLAYLAFRYGHRSRLETVISKHPDACIVIGPAGMAMVQGDIQGAIRWDEITKVHLRTAQSVRIGGAPGLMLRVTGGEIVVLDIYDHSPGELERIIRANLEQPLAG